MFFHNSFQNININTEKDKERERERERERELTIHKPHYYPFWDIAFSKESYLWMGPAILPVNQP